MPKFESHKKKTSLPFLETYMHGDLRQFGSRYMYDPACLGSSQVPTCRRSRGSYIITRVIGGGVGRFNMQGEICLSDES